MSYNLTNLRIRIEDFLSKGSKIDRSDLHHLINNIDTNVRQEIVVSYDDIKQSVYNLCEVIFIHSEKSLDNCLRLAFNFMDSTAQIETLNQRLDSMKKRYGIAGGRINRPFTGPDRIKSFEEANENLTKEGERMVLKIKPKIAPYKVGIFPLVKKEGLPEKAREIFNELSDELHCYYDASGSIGRRYRRQDEVGTNYGITVDFDSMEKGLVTLRERDSMQQVIVKLKDVKDVLRKLVSGEMEFKDAGKLKQ